ncbi:hypothetical protein H0H92_004300 [Tricholoma furcatifolium]|nr:hypothetical protein H0H92_004300 [Tricholoma furcatifolium]
MSDTKLEGQSDPGPERRSRSGCKCSFFSCCGVLSVGIIAFVLYLCLQYANEFLNALLTPHEVLYYKSATQTVTNINRVAVVRPLVDREQTFDLAATVWLRTSKEATHIGGIYAAEGAEAVEDAELEAGGAVNGVEEQALFSDIIFRGVRLSDKNLHTTVNFTLPTDLFKHANLTNYDLRGSVVLIPSSPSLLDYATYYSSYIPESLSVLPVRAWPFPLGSQDIHEKTLVDNILESFAVSVPLLQFHGIQSQCASPTHDDSTTATISDSEEEDDLSETPPSIPTPDIDQSFPPIALLETTNGMDPVKYHPYIVTRSQIRLLDEHRLYDRQAFVQAHRYLKETSCGQDVLVRPNQFHCKRYYRMNGNWETLVPLRVPDESGVRSHREWAYAPYFYVSRYGLGQKDLMPVPVRRENCSEFGAEAVSPSGDSEPSTINVSWKVSFWGRSPAKMALVDMFDWPLYYAFNTTEEEMVFQQDNAELAHGLTGQKYRKDAHPRRRWFIFLLVNVLSMSVAFLEVHYWQRTTSTVSISIPGTTLGAASELLDRLDFFLVRSVTESFSATALTLASLILPLTKLMAVYRLHIDTSDGWIPTIYRTEATHMERASERIEARTTRQQKIALFLSVLAIYYFFPLQEMTVISAITVLKPKPENEVTGHFSFSQVLYLLYAMDMVGMLLQVILNWRSQTFAGRMRASAVLTLLRRLSELAFFVPALVGRFDTRGALSAHEVLECTIACVFVWQAFRLPNPQEDSYEDHIE